MSKLKVLHCGEANFLNTGYAKYNREVNNRLHNSNKFEIGELAAYGHPNDPRGKSVPWQYFGNGPDNEQDPGFQSRIDNQFGAYRFEETCLKFQPDVIYDIRDIWMCVGENTPIYAIDDIKNISDIQINDLVLSHTGKYQKVTDIIKRSYSGNVYKIKTRYFLESDDITEKHPLLVIRHKKGKKLPSIRIAEWAEIQTIDYGDILCYPVQQYTNNILLHNDFCRLLGYFIAEGCWMYNGKKSENKYDGVQFAFNINELDYINDIINISKNLYNKEVIVKHIPSKNLTILRIYSKELAYDFSKYCHEGTARQKYLLEPIYNAPKENLCSMLCGLIRGDGHISSDEKRSTYSTVSKKLTYQLFNIFIRLGCLPSISYTSKNRLYNKTFDKFQFNFCGISKDIFDNIYIKEELIDKRHNLIDDNYAYLTITDIQYQEKELQVYNLEVENDNSYVSSFVMHNCMYQQSSPFRKIYNWAIMPAVDGWPQDEQWIAMYNDADAVFGYTDWGLDVICKQSNNSIKTHYTNSPGADLSIFRPLVNKTQHKIAAINRDIFIIGTVMRNQKRKLYPDLIEGFRLFLDKCLQQNKSLHDKTYLYLHTSYPDVGWDIPRLIKESGIGHKILFTYLCRACGTAFPMIFQDAMTTCPKCHQLSAGLTHVQNPVPESTLSNIINLFDIYVQYSALEGFGMPMVEAAACGVPVMAVDYSGMSDVLKKLGQGGIPINVQRYYREAETHRYFALPDNQDFVDKLMKFFNLPEPMRKKKGFEARKAAERFYNWDNTAKGWEKYFDKIGPANWKAPLEIHHADNNIQDNVDNSIFLKNAAIKILGGLHKISHYQFYRMLKDLNYGITIGHTGGIYINECSALGQAPRSIPYTKENAIKELQSVGEYWNKWEFTRGKTMGII